MPMADPTSSYNGVPKGKERNPRNQTDDGKVTSMVQIGNYAVDITITIQNAETANLLGIENDGQRLDVAYDAIDWDEIEDELTSIAQALVAKQGTKVRSVVKQSLPEENPADEALVDLTGDAKKDPFGVWCRFFVIPMETEDRYWYPMLEIDDIRPALDAMSIRLLPEWGSDWSHWSHSEYRDGAELIKAIKQVGLVDVKAWQDIEFDDIDEHAYEDYYDERARKEGLPPVERWEQWEPREW